MATYFGNLLVAASNQVRHPATPPSASYLKRRATPSPSVDQVFSSNASTDSLDEIFNTQRPFSSQMSYLPHRPRRLPTRSRRPSLPPNSSKSTRSTPSMLQFSRRTWNKYSARCSLPEATLLWSTTSVPPLECKKDLGGTA